MDTRTLSTPGTRIKQHRLEHEWTQRDLARELGVDQLTVSRWERDKTPPSDLNRVRLGRIFGVHPTRFLPNEFLSEEDL